MEASDLLFINESFRLAQEAYDLQEVPVGCVFVFDGLIIGRGHNEVNKTKNPTRHAEFVAMDQANDWCCQNGTDFQEVMEQTTVYVSLEPCIMCSSALYQLKIKRLLFGAKNLRFGGILSVASNKDYGHEHEIETKRQKENIPHESCAVKKSKTSKRNDDVNLITQLDNIYLVKHSSVIVDFWNMSISIDPKSPTEAFNSLNSLKLVGPFRYLNDFYSKSKENKNNNYLLVDVEGELRSQSSRFATVDRFSTDLPEMQTFAIYKGGRFCFWRDLPNEEPNLIINISNNSPNFPTFTIAGNGDPLSALTFLACLKKKFENIFKKIENQSEIMSKWKVYQQKKFLEELRKNRKEITVGEPLHGLGIKVEIVGDCGYRPVTENTKKLRNDLIDFATTKDETHKAKLKQQLLQIYTYVTIANDEMDFGMGLEFGHNLFISNYECFDAMTKSVLEVTYKLLKREVFAKILKEQWENGRRINENKKVI